MKKKKKLNLKENSNHIKSVIDLILNLLKCITNDENENILNFIKQQLILLTTPTNNFRYSSELLIFSSILKSISSHAYNFIRLNGHMILPHPETLRKLSNNMQISPQLELLDDNFLKYITNRINFINEYEKTVILLIDEIHIKPYFDYKGGSIIGAAFDSNNAATSAYVYMISSVLSALKEVVHILPVASINNQILHNVTKKVIVGLENTGIKVISVVTDNNSINGRSMSLFVEPPQKSFVYPHPIDPEKPLFFLLIQCTFLKILGTTG